MAILPVENKQNLFKKMDTPKQMESIPKIYIIMVLLFFAGYISIAYVGHYTLISTVLISRIVAFFSVIFLLVPFKIYKRILKFNVYEIVIFNLLAIGPSITAMLFWINFLFPVEIVEEVYLIKSKQMETVGTFNANKHTIILENEAYANFPEIRIFENSDYAILVNANAIHYTFGKGIFGYSVVLDYEFLE